MSSGTLRKLREWLTIGEAATELSTALGESVSFDDVLRLVLDGQLKLSINLPANTPARCKKVSHDDPHPPEKHQTIDGVWDVPMFGRGKTQIEHDYEWQRAHHFVPKKDPIGALVENDDLVCQLPPDHGTTGLTTRASSEFPQGSVLVIRRPVLEKFISEHAPAATHPATSPQGSNPSGDVNWSEHWREQDAWTVREFACLCCGLNPKGVDNFPNGNMEQYNEARDSITRAVRVKVLRTIDELAWPPTGAEQMFEATPAFKPSEVAAWAAKRYPSRFPYSADAWDRDKASGHGIDEKPLGTRERTTLLTIIAALAKAAKIDVSKPVKAGDTIATLISGMGLRSGAEYGRRPLANPPQDPVGRNSGDTRKGLKRSIDPLVPAIDAYAEGVLLEWPCCSRIGRGRSTRGDTWRSSLPRR